MDLVLGFSLLSYHFESKQKSKENSIWLDTQTEKVVEVMNAGCKFLSSLIKSEKGRRADLNSWWNLMLVGEMVFISWKGEEKERPGCVPREA